MLGDVAVCLAAVLLPLLCSGACYVFLRRRRAATATGWCTLLLGNALVFLLLLSLLFLLGESYFRFLHDTTDSFSQTRTSRAWFDRHFERNNAGFRDSEDYLFRRSSGPPRISFVGDSFTAGHGIANVEDRFANRVRNARPGRWEVQVLAEVGRDTGAEIKLLRDLRDQGYQFQTVVLVYCLNDINDIVPAQQQIEQRSDSPTGLLPSLVEHSFLVNTYYYRIKARLDPDVSRYYDYVLSAYEGELWDQQKERLAEFESLCTAAGARLLVVVFPFVHCLGPEYPYREIHEKLTSFWRERGVPCLDLLSTFDRHAGEQLTVNRYDAHPNERAHAVAADSILDYLEAQP